MYKMKENKARAQKDQGTPGALRASTSLALSIYYSLLLVLRRQVRSSGGAIAWVMPGTYLRIYKKFEKPGRCPIRITMIGIEKIRAILDVDTVPHDINYLGSHTPRVMHSDYSGLES